MNLVCIIKYDELNVTLKCNLHETIFLICMSTNRNSMMR